MGEEELVWKTLFPPHNGKCCANCRFFLRRLDKGTIICSSLGKNPFFRLDDMFGKLEGHYYEIGEGCPHFVHR